jgi:hypothetical protein
VYASSSIENVQRTSLIPSDRQASARSVVAKDWRARKVLRPKAFVLLTHEQPLPAQAENVAYRLTPSFRPTVDGVDD